jgi:hypothetical protein
VLLGAGGLAVDSSSPDALCPPLAETRRAVADRLGSVELEGTWHATYVLAHRAQGDFVSLRLVDPEGNLRLERELPVQAGSCATLSQVVALVLERFFSRPEHPTQEEASAVVPPDAAAPSEPPDREASPPSAAPQAPDAAPDTARPIAPASAPVLRAPRFAFAAALWTTNAWLAPAIRFESRVSGPFRLALGAGYDLVTHETAAAEGSLSLHRVPLSVLASWRFQRRPSFDASVALEVLGVLEQARAVGLRDNNVGTRVVPGIGARLGLNFLSELTARPFVELTAAWLVRGAAPAFQVGEQQVFTPTAQVLGIAFGISTPF